MHLQYLPCFVIDIDICIYSTCASCLCVKRFVDVRIYRTCAFLLSCFVLAFCRVDIDVCEFIVLVLFYCQVDVEVDNVQRRELVNITGIELYKSCYNY